MTMNYNSSNNDLSLPNEGGVGLQAPLIIDMNNIDNNVLSMDSLRFLDYPIAPRGAQSEAWTQTSHATTESLYTPQNSPSQGSFVWDESPFGSVSSDSEQREYHSTMYEVFQYEIDELSSDISELDYTRHGSLNLPRVIGEIYAYSDDSSDCDHEFDNAFTPYMRSRFEERVTRYQELEADHIAQYGGMENFFVNYCYSVMNMPPFSREDFWDREFLRRFDPDSNPFRDRFLIVDIHFARFMQSHEEEIEFLLNYDSSNDSLTSCESECDNEFYLPHIDYRLEPQSGEFSEFSIADPEGVSDEPTLSGRDIGHVEHKSSEEDTAYAAHREQEERHVLGQLFFGEKQSVLSGLSKGGSLDLPQEERSNDSLGDQLQSLQKIGNFGILIDVVTATYNFTRKIRIDGSAYNISWSLLEFYTAVTGTKVSQLLELPKFMHDIFNIAPALEPQAGLFGVSVGDILSGWSLLKTSLVAEKIKKLCTLMSVIGISSALGFSAGEGIFSAIWDKIKKSLTQVDLIAQVCEVISMIYEKCIGFFTTGDWGFFADVSQMQSLDSDIATLHIQADRVLHGNEIDGDPDLIGMLGTSMNLMNACHRYSRVAESPAHRAKFAAQKLKMGILYNMINNKVRSSPTRPCAGTFLLHGGAGTGKSILVPFLVDLSLKAMGLPHGAENVYTYQPNDEYMNNFSTSMRGMIIDDIANAAPLFSKINPSDLLISMVNNSKTTAVQASLDDKGKSDILSAVIGMTSNRRDLNAKTYSVCPDAALRRTGINMEIKVKPEFCQPGTNFIRRGVDARKENYDLWIITVDTYNASTTTYDLCSDADGELENVSLPRAARFLAQHMKEHRENQMILLQEMKDMENEEYCEHMIPTFMCDMCVRLPPVPDVPLEVQAGSLRDPWDLYRKNIKWKIVAGEVYYGPVSALDMGRGLLACGAAVILTDIYFHGKLNVLSSLTIMLWFVFAIRLAHDISVLTKFAVTYIRLSDLSRSIRDKILGKSAIAIGVAVGAIGALTLYRRMQTKYESQGSAVSYPKYEKNVPEDIWKKPFVEPRFIDAVNPTSTGKQISELISTKMRVLLFYDERHDGNICIGMPLCTYMMLAPTHMVKKGNKYMSILRADSNTHNGETVVLLEGATYPIPNTDYTIVYTPSIGDEVDMRKFFPSRRNLRGGKLDLKNIPCRILYAKYLDTIDEQGNAYKRIERYNRGINVTSTRVIVEGSPPLEGASYNLPENTYRGLCGAVAVTEGSDPFIFGIHCAGYEGTKKGMLNTLYREDIEDVISLMTGPKTAIMQGAQQVPFHLDHPKMPFREGLPDLSTANFVVGQGKWLGSHSGQLRTMRSSVIVSPISESVELKTGVQRIHGKPAFFNHWSPPSNWANACMNPAIFPQSRIDEAYNDRLDSIMEYLNEHPEDKELIHKIPDDVVVNGMDGIKGCGALNMNTSIGLFENRPKKEFLVETDKKVPGISCVRTYNDDIMRAYNEMEEKLLTGDRVYSPFRVNVKDEATKLTKAKVRIFCGGQNSLLMLLRKYFLTVSMFMQNHMELFESAVGANSTGRDWDELHKIITKHGRKRMVAGDYSKFDQYVMNAITLASFKILIAICIWAGYDAEDIAVMEALATEVCNPVYEMNGLWLLLNSSTASGHSLTVVINGLNNCIYMRMAYYGLKPCEHIDRFEKCVALMTYGDDNVMSVRDDCGWFNHTSIQQWLSTYGITYTMADKLEDSIPFIDIDDVSFLKRRWVWDDDMLLYKCPLEEESIFKMLHTVLKSKAETVEQQVGNIISTANREFFQHGREKFTKMHEVLTEIAEEHDLTHYIPNSHLETYDELQEWMMR